MTMTRRIAVWRRRLQHCIDIMVPGVAWHTRLAEEAQARHALCRWTQPTASLRVRSCRDYLNLLGLPLSLFSFGRQTTNRLEYYENRVEDRWCLLFSLLWRYTTVLGVEPFLSLDFPCFPAVFGGLAQFGFWDRSTLQAMSPRLVALLGGQKRDVAASS